MSIFSRTLEEQYEELVKDLSEENKRQDYNAVLAFPHRHHHFSAASVHDDRTRQGFPSASLL
jgi:hypothetical protein